MPAKQEKHVHKLKKVKFKSGNATFFCALPDCTYKINPALALGKRTICWRCGEEFIMNDYSLRLTKPHCESCHKTKKDIHDLDGSNDAYSEHTDIRQSLAERLTKTIHDAKHENDEEEI